MTGVSMFPLGCCRCGVRFAALAEIRHQWPTFHYPHRLMCDGCDAEEVARELRAEREHAAWMEAGGPMGWWRQ